MKTFVHSIVLALVASSLFFACQKEAEEANPALPKKPTNGYSKDTFKRKDASEVDYYQFKRNYWPGVPDPYDTYIEGKLGGSTSGAGPLDVKYYEDGTGAGGPSPYLGDSPMFIMDIADQQAYPKFANLVRNIRYFVENDVAVLNALIKWSAMSKDEVLQRLNFGQGPKIVIKELNGAFGYFKASENPNVINIAKSWVLGVETANLKSTFQATSFLMAVTILHESVHQARHQQHVDEDTWEYGWGFEESAFGEIVDATNAYQYSWRMYKK